LALCGNSGCGKSTAVELICAELGVEMLVWSEDNWEADSYSMKNHDDYKTRLKHIIVFDNIFNTLI